MPVSAGALGTWRISSECVASRERAAADAGRVELGVGELDP